MAERLDDKSKAALRSYLTDVSGMPNESAKIRRFSSLIGELFPGSPAITESAAVVATLGAPVATMKGGDEVCDVYKRDWGGSTL